MRTVWFAGAVVLFGAAGPAPGPGDLLGPSSLEYRTLGRTPESAGPLLGGLGGMPPVNASRTPGAAGLPPGGRVIVAPARPTHRPFTGEGRPVAGIDEQYR